MREDDRYGVGWLVRVVAPGLYAGEVGCVIQITPDTWHGRAVLFTTLAENGDGSGARRRFLYEDLVAVARPQKEQ